MVTDLHLSGDKKPLVLVVDDDWMNREVLEAYLSAAGCDVINTNNGADALSLALETPPDLIVMDVNLTGLNGYEVCSRLKNHEILQFTPVVFLTALDADSDRLRAIQAGADDFLTKPFDSVLMMTRIRNLLRIKALHDELQARNALQGKVLSRYVDEDIVEVVMGDPDRYLRLGGETRHVTVFFADIRGFTAFAEKYPAAEVLQLLNRIFNELTEIVVTNHGTLDKYIGDELMAFFGAPVTSDLDAFNAVKAGIEMQQAFERVCRELDWPEVQRLGLGIGIHTGDVAVGNVGSERLMSYTVIGDVVNTARRIQEIAEAGVTLISAHTYRQVADNVVAERLPPQNFQGKSQPITVYRLVSLRT
ncbi:MAG: hypothetical protein Kow0077_24820 [Anaerolineae bacterium]